MDLTADVLRWIHDPNNFDQKADGKRSFIKTAKTGPPSNLSAVGISNPVVKRYGNELYKQYKHIPLMELLPSFNELWINGGLTEIHVLVPYLLGKFHNQLDDKAWIMVDAQWINRIDYWMSADHLCIDLLGYFDAHIHHKDELAEWARSDNFWRCRMALTTLVKNVRKDPLAADCAISIAELLLDDKNYYVKKAIHWVLSEANKSNESGVVAFLDRNFDRFNKTQVREIIKRMRIDHQESFLDRYSRARDAR